MATREKFGRFILLEEVDTTALGSEYRAAKLGPSGFEKIVSVERLKPALGANAEVAKSLLDHVKAAAQIQNPNVVKIFGIGKIDSSYYISYEFLEGKSLKAVLKRCCQESFPFSVDHALLVASKTCSALEQAHARKSENGGRYFHGLVTPDNVVVTYEGEVRVRGFGYWPSRIREAGGLDDADRRYLAPEQVTGAFGDTRSDTFGVGALLFEMLTGQPLFAEARDGGDPSARVGRARLWNPTTDDDSLPKPIAEILRRALAVDPGARYAEIQEMRKAVDTLLFSGDFTPTTFNLAFFMHSLFRDDIERESRRLKEEREASYAEPVPEDTPTPPLVPAPVAPPPPATITPPPPAASGGAAAAKPAAPAPSPSAALPLIPPPPRNAPIRPEAHPGPSHPATVPYLEPAGAGSTFHKGREAGKKKPNALLIGGIAAAVLLAAAGGWAILRRSAPPPAPATPPPSTLSAEAVAAMQKVKELEDKLKTIEDEKAAAEARAAEEAKKRVEAQAAAHGQRADAAAVERAQDEARRRAQAETERKAQEERKRLEDEQKAAEARLAEERRRAQAEAARAAAAATPVPIASAPPVAEAPAVKPGTLVNMSDAGVIAPVTVSAPPLRYPPIAERQKVEGTVELNILVDEKGNVVEALLVTPAGGKSGLNEAAVDNVKRRRYRPATKDGVPVKVWLPVSVRFVLPR